MKSKIGIIGFGQKPQIEVFQKASKELTQSPEYSFEKIFHQLWSKIESEINIDLNKKGFQLDTSINNIDDLIKALGGELHG